jgi:hypothetical protein
VLDVLYLLIALKSLPSEPIVINKNYIEIRGMIGHLCLLQFPKKNPIPRASFHYISLKHLELV